MGYFEMGAPTTSCCGVKPMGLNKNDFGFFLTGLEMNKEIVK